MLFFQSLYFGLVDIHMQECSVDGVKSKDLHVRLISLPWDHRAAKATIRASVNTSCNFSSVLTGLSIGINGMKHSFSCINTIPWPRRPFKEEQRNDTARGVALDCK